MIISSSSSMISRSSITGHCLSKRDPTGPRTTEPLRVPGPVGNIRLGLFPFSLRRETNLPHNAGHRLNLLPRRRQHEHACGEVLVYIFRV